MNRPYTLSLSPLYVLKAASPAPDSPQSASSIPSSPSQSDSSPSPRFTLRSPKPALHTVQVFFFTIFITLVLLAIADVNLPFRGWVHVSNYAFVRAQQNMND